MIIESFVSREFYKVKLAFFFKHFFGDCSFSFYDTIRIIPVFRCYMPPRRIGAIFFHVSLVEVFRQ